MNDWQLLRKYVEEESQDAFATILERYMDLVYTTCRRDVRDAQLAEDTTQKVFLRLACKAATIRKGVSIAGWLFVTARLSSRDAMKSERRRKCLEERAAQDMLAQSQNETEWQEVEPYLNDCLSALSLMDREAILLRFYQGYNHSEIGVHLSITEEAARKRVSRAIDRLRDHIAKKRITITSFTLTAVLSLYATINAPESCYASVSNAISGIGAAGTITTITHSPLLMLKKGVLIIVENSIRKITIGVVCLAVVSGVAVSISSGKTQHGTGKISFSDTTLNKSTSNVPLTTRQELDKIYQKELEAIRDRDMNKAYDARPNDYTITPHLKDPKKLPASWIAEIVKPYPRSQVLQGDNEWIKHFSKVNPSITIQNYSANGEEIAVTLRIYIDGISGSSDTYKNTGSSTLQGSMIGNGESSDMPGSHTMTDSIRTDHWTKRNGQWWNDNSTIEGVSAIR